jgi:hypothetical protein
VLQLFRDVVRKGVNVSVAPEVEGRWTS